LNGLPSIKTPIATTLLFATVTRWRAASTDFPSIVAASDTHFAPLTAIRMAGR
jgi:hypothetical protein